MNENQTLDISWGTILKVGVAFLGFYILYLIKDILVWIIFALIISILLNPAIDFLQKRKIPRILSAILIYLLVFGIFGLLIYLVAPVFVSEIQQFAQLFPQYFEKSAPFLRSLGMAAFENFETFTKVIQDWLIKASASIFSAIVGIFGGIISTITIFTIALFISLEEGGIERAIRLISPRKYEDYILNLWQKSQNKVAGWFGSRILSCLFVGLMIVLSAKILSIKYAYSFGIITGITNIIPIIGPIIAGIIIFIFTVLDSLWKTVLILVSLALINQIEGNVLTPILTKKFIGLPPVLVIISLMIGGRLWGILGAILVIPLAGVIYEFLRDFLREKKEETVAL